MAIIMVMDMEEIANKKAHQNDLMGFLAILGSICIQLLNSC